MKYCTKCWLPSTKPDLSFDKYGVCSACTAFENRIEVDWSMRSKEFTSMMSPEEFVADILNSYNRTMKAYK